MFCLENVTIYFLKDVLSTKKTYLYNTEVKTIYVPQYKNLTLECISGFVSTRPQVANYLPDPEDLPKIPKQWIVNVCAAVIGDDFRTRVSQ